MRGGPDDPAETGELTRGECSIGDVDDPHGRDAPPADPVTSRRHPVVGRFRRVARGEDPDVLLLDGLHLVEVALETAWPLDLLVLAAPATPAAAALAARARAGGATVLAVSRHVIDAISPVRSPGEIVALARRQPAGLADPFGDAHPLVVVACDVQDPGNVGAIVRAADGCGATGAIAAGACADPFGWKALRGSMGSALRLPIRVERDRLAVRHAIQARQLAVIAAAGGPGAPPEAIDWTRPTALLVGNEGQGLPADLAAGAARVAIPMREGVESFNVAVATGILLYEAARQRRERQ